MCGCTAAILSCVYSVARRRRTWWCVLGILQKDHLFRADAIKSGQTEDAPNGPPARLLGTTRIFSVGRRRQERTGLVVETEPQRKDLCSFSTWKLRSSKGTHLQRKCFRPGPVPFRKLHTVLQCWVQTHLNGQDPLLCSRIRPISNQQEQRRTLRSASSALMRVIPTGCP